MSGRYVYAIGIEGSTLVKIGMSRNPVSRLKTLEQSMPYTLVILHQVWREDAVGSSATSIAFCKSVSSAGNGSTCQSRIWRGCLLKP